MTIVQNIECNLGYVMQTELAVQAISLFVAIFDRLKALFARYSLKSGPGAKESEEEEKKQESAPDMLGALTTLNIEGADPACFSVFESVHPLPSGTYSLKNSYRVPRAIGYMIEFDTKTAKTNEGSITLRTSRSVFDVHTRDISSYKSLVLVGSSLSIRFKSNERDQKSWGVKLTVKPIIGKPKLISKGGSSAEVRELESFLTSAVSRLEGDATQVTSWLSLVNRVVFLASFLTRGLLDADLTAE